MNQRYSTDCQQLIDAAPPCELGAGAANETCRAALGSLTAEKLSPGGPVRDRTMVSCCISGLWLLHNFLDESHSLSQEISTATGSYWHGIMHRREGDFGNAKYWFRRVGEHPVFDSLRTASRNEANAWINEGNEKEKSCDFLMTQASWDPYRFVDLCEAACRGRSKSVDLCRRIAVAEWRLLFDFCYRQAFGV